MTITQDRAGNLHQGKGSSDGGQFAEKQNARPSGGLGAIGSPAGAPFDGLLQPVPDFDAKQLKWRQGFATLDDGTFVKVSYDRGFESRAFKIGGTQAGHTANQIAVAAWREQHGPVDAQLEALQGQKVTLLVASGTGQMGLSAANGSVSLMEGTLTTYRGAPLLIPKGGRGATGYPIDAARVLAAVNGYGQAQRVGEEWFEHKAHNVPELTHLDDVADVLEGIPDAESIDLETTNTPFAAAYVLNVRDFNGGAVYGSVFFATDVQRGDGPHEPSIVNGFHVFPGGHQMTSEHGSMYAHDLERQGAGRITDYVPGSRGMGDVFERFYDGQGTGGADTARDIAAWALGKS